MTGLVAGLRWENNGVSTLSGTALELFERVDRWLRALADRWPVTELRCPPMISAAALDRVDFFRSFPHLATFPVSLDADEDNLQRFREGEPVGADGYVRLHPLSRTREVLTPAACYHAYAGHCGERLAQPVYLSLAGTCFRRENAYVPLERQWCFTMREIVCIGSADHVREFLDRTRADVNSAGRALGLPLAWQPATDPFFRPAEDPGYVMQRIDPTKHELVFDARLAIASANLHHDHFGRSFDIRWAADGSPVHSACVAFGVERWMAAVIDRFGAEPGAWRSAVGRSAVGRSAVGRSAVDR
jgi:seryl-tRNA synthetase